MKNFFTLSLLAFLFPYQDDCRWCGAFEAPSGIGPKTVIATKEEPGERMIISGMIYDYDGTTPAADVIVYVYHTNVKGVYPKKGDEEGNGRYHGYLRGWMKTDAEGRYSFESIKPAPYSTHGGEPAHVHYTLLPPGEKEYWINSVWFKDDPRVTEELLQSLKRVGTYSNVVELEKGDDEIWRGVRNIVLARY